MSKAKNGIPSAPPSPFENTCELGQALTAAAREAPVESTAGVILFVDVTGSTRLYASLGDEQAHGILDACLRQLTDLAAKSGGRVVKTMGDGLMALFETADAALDGAMHMQLGVSARPPGGYPIAIHVGINQGPLLHKAGDVFGDTVNIGAYMCALALGEQILVTEAVVRALSPTMRARVRQAFYAEIKGGEQEAIVYQVLWRDEALELTDPNPRRIPASAVQIGGMILSWFGMRELSLNYRRRRVVLGRAPECDVVVADRAVSRTHAVISVQRTQLYLADQSINGTYVRLSSGAEVHVSRGELLLDGEGHISLGRPFADAPVEQLIAFKRDRRSMFRP
ncbi:MAG: adenylate/guanylate cyclase domain-containing protein [Gammaproteobacteria bacterium]|nr:adenylate/guanylate cyclase domain-containing protein [Gammaproteobacteria bacterium]MBI5616517.1 adenylate/guanylate cyclase domain-containing protein [Gammaproteobacteria bacterium]